VAAEAAAAYAQDRWRHAEGQSAAYWFEAARRIDSRDWRYHWYAGQFWAAQAAARSDSAAARLADVALAAAVSANGRDAHPLLSRIELHSRLRKVLAAPADAETLRAWASRAAELAPMDGAVRAEREQIFREFPAAGRQ
jgi:hypothetical protein